MLAVNQEPEDALFLNFLEANPGALALYHMVLQQQEAGQNQPAGGLSTRSPRKSQNNANVHTRRMSMTTSLAKSPGKLISIGKSPKKSLSVTNVVGKSPAKQPPLPIGKSPAKQPPLPIGKSPAKLPPLQIGKSPAKQPPLQIGKSPSKNLPTFSPRNGSSLLSNSETERKNRPPFGEVGNRIGEPLSARGRIEDTKEKKSRKEQKKKDEAKDKKSKKEQKKKDKTKKKPSLKEDDMEGPPPPTHKPAPPPPEALFHQDFDPTAVFKGVADVATGYEFKNRNYRLRSYKASCVASEFICWLLSNRYVRSHDQAIGLGQLFIKKGLIEHCEKSSQTFQDRNWIYVLTEEGKTIRNESMYHYFGLVFDSHDGVEIKERTWHLKKCKASFVAEEFVGWFLRQGLLENREDATKIGRLFMEFDLIEHISQESHFKDNSHLYYLTRRGIERKMNIGAKKLRGVAQNITSLTSLTPVTPITPITPLSDANEKLPDKTENFEEENLNEEIAENGKALNEYISSFEEDDASTSPDNPFSTPEKGTKERKSESTEPPILPNEDSLELVQDINDVLPSNLGPLLYVPRKSKGPANRRPPSLKIVVNKIGTTSSDHILEQEIKEPKEKQVETEEGKDIPQEGVQNEKVGNFGKEKDVILEAVKIDQPNKPNNNKNPMENSFELGEYLKCEENVKLLRKFLVKSSKFQEVDCLDFLQEYLEFEKETVPRQKISKSREIYKTFISDTSPHFILLPINLVEEIQCLMQDRNSVDVFSGVQAFVMAKLNDIVCAYLTSSVYLDSISAKKSEPLIPSLPSEDSHSHIDSEDYFIQNLDFCYAVSMFKVNFPTSSISERIEEYNQIISKFLGGPRGQKPCISITNKSNLDEVIKAVSNGAPLKIDVFDKLLNDVSISLNATSSSSSKDEGKVKNREQEKEIETETEVERQKKN